MHRPFRPPLQPTQWGGERTDVLDDGAMCNENYKEEKGGARLDEVWHSSTEGGIEGGVVMSVIRLSSA